ncbi:MULTISPECIES: type II toxin-antitoxin system PemK/MazF family toxin [Nostocales]|uniref:Cell division protein n=3 Tax=Nostocales TaxID=1161 RepID=A0A8S9TBU7_9CYAN|nr:type II toxin-antitoxin system PemK/MazF family toxin [Tolypothrix bouteillei]KAF3890041.1 cell division protein [Tolypothrix bouteillei VB521301]
MSSPYIPERGDIVKLEFGLVEITADLIKRAFTLKNAGMSFEGIAKTLNSDLERQGLEQQGYRPVLVLSPFKYNKMSSMVLVCPITSQKKGLSFEVALMDGMKTKGVILTDQVKSLDWKARKVLFVEKVEQDLIEEVQARIETLIL